jgi:hypothetical protein
MARNYRPGQGPDCYKLFTLFTAIHNLVFWVRQTINLPLNVITFSYTYCTLYTTLKSLRYKDLYPPDEFLLYTPPSIYGRRVFSPETFCAEPVGHRANLFNAFPEPAIRSFGFPNCLRAPSSPVNLGEHELFQTAPIST